MDSFVAASAMTKYSFDKVRPAVAGFVDLDQVTDAQKLI
jgi:hypothetical protein